MSAVIDASPTKLERDKKQWHLEDESVVPAVNGQKQFRWGIGGVK